MQRFWQSFPKSGQTPPIRWRDAILVTAVQVKARLGVIVRTLSGYDVLLCQPRLVATGELLGTASGTGFPGSEGWR